MARRTFGTIAAIAALLAVPGSLFAQQNSMPDQSERHMPRHEMRGGDGPIGMMPDGMMVGRFFDKLDLSAEQKQRIDAIFASARPQMQTMHEQGRKMRDSWMTMSPKDPGYAAAVAQAKQDAAKRIDFAADLHAKVYGVLTPEQQAKIPQIVAEQRQLWQARGEKMRDGRQHGEHHMGEHAGAAKDADKPASGDTAPPPRMQ